MSISNSPARHRAVAGLVLGLVACGGSEAAQLPPPNVTIVTTAATDIPASIELVGQGAASKFIEVRSQLNGVIIERPYREGSDVEAGTVLFRLDPTIYEATYRSAKAAAENAQARLDNAQRTLKRLTPLLAEGAVSQKDVDDATTELQQAQAGYAEAQANADRAEKDFNDTSIRAEIPGRVGRAELPLGARVTGPADVLTDLQQIDPVYVYFSPSDLDLLRFRRERDGGEAGVQPSPRARSRSGCPTARRCPRKGRSTSPTCRWIPGRAPSSTARSSGTPSTPCSPDSSSGCGCSA